MDERQKNMEEIVMKEDKEIQCDAKNSDEQQTTDDVDQNK